MSQERPGLLGALLARGPAHVTRLSLLFAFLDQQAVIDVPHLAAAVAWWDYATASAKLIFHDRSGNDAADRIRTEMMAGKEMTVTEIREKIFANKITAGRLRDALDLLCRLKEVSLSTQRTGGRPALVVRPPRRLRNVRTAGRKGGQG